jgi:hypothetical protein
MLRMDSGVEATSGCLKASLSFLHLNGKCLREVVDKFSEGNSNRACCTTAMTTPN